MRQKLSNIFLGLGILFLIAGVFLYLTFWFFIYGFGSLILGAILILLTTKNWKLKLICVGVPFTFVGISVYLSFSPAEAYLIPDDYKGRFRVIYGERYGVIPTYENGRRVMIIPENGILIIQPEFKAGWVNNKYYLIDKNGNRKKIYVLSDYKERSEKFPGILMGGSGSMAGVMPNGSLSSESPLAIHFTDFTVFNIDTTQLDERAEFRFHQRFDSLTNTLVDNCRKKNGL